MAVALILSSSVAANRIGGGAQALALAALGIDPILVPTVQFGRSPPLGGRGRATDAVHFAQMLEDVEAAKLLPYVDLVITGHFSLPEQVAAAAAMLDRVRAASPKAIRLVDPVLGDEPRGLYVKPDVAEAVIAELIPRADWLTPNLWELGRITGETVGDAQAVVRVTARLPAPALVTSAPAPQGKVGLILAEPGGAHLLTHPRLASAPNGTGDLIAALFGAGLLEGHAPLGAAARAASAVFDLAQTALEWGAPDLPIVALRERLSAPHQAIHVEKLT